MRTIKEHKICRYLVIRCLLFKRILNAYWKLLNGQFSLNTQGENQSILPLEN